MDNLIEKIKEIINSEYDSEACGYTSERSEGNYDDVFNDGYECGKSDLAYQIGKLLDMELEEPQEQEYSWE